MEAGSSGPLLVTPANNFVHEVPGCDNLLLIEGSATARRESERVRHVITWCSVAGNDVIMTHLLHAYVVHGGEAVPTQGVRRTAAR